MYKKLDELENDIQKTAPCLTHEVLELLSEYVMCKIRNDFESALKDDDFNNLLKNITIQAICK